MKLHRKHLDSEEQFEDMFNASRYYIALKDNQDANCDEIIVYADIVNINTSEYSGRILSKDYIAMENDKMLTLPLQCMFHLMYSKAEPHYTIAT